MDEKFGSILLRSSHSQIFYKISIFEKFCYIHRETPVLESLFNKVTHLKACNLIKKNTRYKYFPVDIEKFLRAAFLQNNSGGFLLLFILDICYFEFQINKVLELATY